MGSEHVANSTASDTGVNLSLAAVFSLVTQRSFPQTEERCVTRLYDRYRKKNIHQRVL